MEVILARADYLRRALTSDPAAAPAAAASDPAAVARLRACFSTASDLMAQYFPDYHDRGLRLAGYWAHVEANVVGDAAAARAVWEAVLKGPMGR
jgi:hypothetical protein